MRRVAHVQKLKTILSTHALLRSRSRFMAVFAGVAAAAG